MFRGQPKTSKGLQHTGQQRKTLQHGIVFPALQSVRPELVSELASTPVLLGGALVPVVVSCVRVVLARIAEG